MLGNLSSAPCLGTATIRASLDPNHPSVVIQTKAYVLENLNFPLILGNAFSSALRRTYIWGSSIQETQISWTAPDGTHLISKTVCGGEHRRGRAAPPHGRPGEELSRGRGPSGPLEGFGFLAGRQAAMEGGQGARSALTDRPRTTALQDPQGHGVATPNFLY